MSTGKKGGSIRRETFRELLPSKQAAKNYRKAEKNKSGSLPQ
jgi:hypothetical protein